MSIFLCARCDEMRDSDDGCAKAPNNGLYCIDCMNELEDEETFHTTTTPAQEAQRVHRMRAEMRAKMNEEDWNGIA